VDRIRTLLSRVASLLRAWHLDAELDEELRSHIDLAAQENLASGMDRHQAPKAAMNSFGGLTQIKEAYRRHRELPLFETLLQDLR
jgi:hypothetical protein